MRRNKMKFEIKCPNCEKIYEPELGRRKHPELLIQQELCDTGGCAFLYDILISGWKGYDEMSDEELKREYDDRYQSF